MKVLMVNSVCGIGSTGRICTDLAEVLESHGHEVRIAYVQELPKLERAMELLKLGIQKYRQEVMNVL